MARPPLDILFEDNHCLAVSKPPGMLSTHYQGKEETIDRDVKRYLKKKHNKPGNVFLGIVHRLDRLVSGVLLFAKTTKAARRIAEQFREGTVEKVYWAVVDGTFPEGSGTFEDWLLKDQKTGKVQLADTKTPGARHAILSFSVQRRRGNSTWLEIRPKTGRGHQIRVQLARRGFPIYGDRKYGSSRSFGKAIALHARSLQFRHPIRKEPITLTAELPAAWRDVFGSLFAEARE
jgi:23S rRNA pseudouridine1911/1915/1917 synthase